MPRYLAILFGLLLLASPAAGDLCTTNSPNGQLWASATSNFGTCSPGAATDTYVVAAVDTHNVVISGDVALTGATGAISAFADAGSGQVWVTSAGNPLGNGDIITITGTTNYNGVFTVSNHGGASFKITTTWVADDGTGDFESGGVKVLGGSLTVPAGVTLTLGRADLEIDGGRFISQGAVVATCYVTAPPVKTDATALTHEMTVELDCPLGSVDIAGLDYLVWDWGEIPGGVESTLNGKNFYAGPGRAPVGAYAPVEPAGKWLPIVDKDAATATVTVDINENAGNYVECVDLNDDCTSCVQTSGNPDGLCDDDGATAQGLPYQGTRHSPTAGNPIDMTVGGADVDACTVSAAGDRSWIALDNSYDAVAFDGDLGAKYAVFEETTTGTYTDGSGLTAKIAHTYDSHAGLGCAAVTCDILVFEGNVCQFSTGTFDIDDGYRRGHLVRVVRPAVIDGDGTGDGQGDAGIYVIDGTFDAQWTVFKNLGAVPTTTPTGSIDLPRRANLGFWVDGTDSATTQADVNISDSAILYPSNEGTGGDTAVVGWYTHNASVWLHPDDPMLDCRRIKMDRIYVADTFDNAAGGGSHGMCFSGCDGGAYSQWRIERMNDDGICFERRLNTASGTQTKESVTFRNMLVYENSAETDNSQQGLDWLTSGALDTVSGIDQQLNNPNWIRAYDILSSGAYSSNLNVEGGGVGLTRVWTGGQAATASPNSKMRVSGTNARVDNDVQTLAPNFVVDSRLSAYSAAGGTAGAPQFAASLNGTFWYGNDLLGDTSNGNYLLYSWKVEDSFIDLDNNGAGSGSTAVLIGGLAGATESSTSFACSNSIFRSESRPRGIAAIATPMNVSFDRCVVMMDTTIAEGPWFNVVSGKTGTTLSLQGVFVTQSQSPAASNWIDINCTDCTLDWNNICAETTATFPSLVFGNQQDEDTLSFAGLAPDHEDVGWNVRDFVADGSGSICGDLSKPSRVGAKTFGWMQAMLGSIFAIDHHKASSDDLIGVEQGGGGGGGGKAF